MEFYIFSVIVIWLTVLTLSLLLLWSRPIPRDEMYLGDMDDPMLEVDENRRLSDKNLRLSKENLRLRRALKEIASYEDKSLPDDSDNGHEWHLYMAMVTAKAALNDRR